MSTHSFPGFHSPGASTEAPLEMLAACHGRVHKQCETLGRLGLGARGELPGGDLFPPGRASLIVCNPP